MIRVGLRSGLVEVVELGARTSDGKPAARVRCACGTERTVSLYRLRRGSPRSCGCANLTHGATRDPEYYVWRSMLQRCTNPRHKSFGDYGARGISVCDRWSSFHVFLGDMGRRPSSRHSIGRVDNDGPYEPGNCRWETMEEQCRNRRTSTRYVAFGWALTIPEWSERHGVKRHTIWRRIKVYGWSIERAVTEAPVRPKAKDEAA